LKLEIFGDEAGRETAAPSRVVVGATVETRAPPWKRGSRFAPPRLSFSTLRVPGARALIAR
jgi:hypothetical protein